jgi:hypothetical protein
VGRRDLHGAGQLWVQAAGGLVAQLNPTTLKVERNLKVFSGSGTDAWGTIESNGRMYITDGKQRLLYSFRLPN